MLDLSHPENLKRHLRKYGLTAKKNFGQNFLIDRQVLEQISSAARLKSSDHVIEIGSGPGVLSQHLAPKCGHLTSLEIDPGFINPWKELMKDYPNAEIIRTDVLDYIPADRPYQLIANIPYSITSPILRHFLRNQVVRRPETIVLMIQKEVAERICSEKKPTLLSWEIRIFGVPEIICKAPPESFFPPPKVDSAVLKISLHDTPLIPAEQQEGYFQLLERAYKQPRKTLLNNLSAAWGKEVARAVLEKSQLDGGRRPHQLSREEWLRILDSKS